MKLAEALVLRADAQKRLVQLRQRITVSARHQEGESPPEDPAELIAEADRTADELEALIRRINLTNGATEFEPGVSLTDALARRDVLGVRRGFLAETALVASVRQDRHTKSEVKFVTAIDVPAIRRRVDELSRDHRELDARIQAKNWEVDLLE